MRLVCCTFCCLYMQLLFAQDISGCWAGTLWQGSGDDAEAFYFEICIQANKSHFEGQSYIQWQSLFARYRLEGQAKDGGIYLQELEVLAHRREQKMDWCTKILRLHLLQTPQGEMLIGSWEGSSAIYGTCQPGRLQLFRKRSDKA